MASFEQARKVADAVLYEGYLLYPYRASAQKNQFRWQFGVLAPRAYGEANDEPWSAQTEVLLEPGTDAALQVVVRFLQLQHRLQPLPEWDEGIEREVEVEVQVGDLLQSSRTVPIELVGGTEAEGEREVQRWPISAQLRLEAERFEGPYGVLKLRAHLENLTPFEGETRDEALHHSLVSAHTLLAVTDGAFISLVDHPEWAAGAVASCHNVHTWPVLVGGRDVMLSSPIILYDQPEIAPESPGALFDSTEIDEILTLRTLALTDEEKREARATDDRAAGIIDRVDDLPPEVWERLHGAVRSVRKVEAGPDSVLVGSTHVGKGSRVRLRPGLRRTDAQDMFLGGRTATVEAIRVDFDDEVYLAVTLEDDPSADLQRWHGRYLYFHPDEVEVDA